MKRHLFSVFPGIAMLAFVFLHAIGSASARHRHSSPSAAGDFTYYMLSLSWSPAFCLSSPGAAECGGPRGFGFIVHGLWPQNEQGWPEHCDVHRPVPEDVVRSIVDLMPARGLVYHEWSAHGTCSGLEPAEYFALVRRAYASIKIPQELTGPTRPIEESPAAVAGAFLHANPRLAPETVVVSCTGQGAPRLREVHICLARDLTPRACSAEALRGACKAPQLIIPPVR
ncbi:MAG TPA: ribonuclease T2 [Steroidobacteraceae bacterium]|jgi:ribonuclease T2|nr:ribonuclease T2 [Steroidobacteraceae bacterium]